MEACKERVSEKRITQEEAVASIAHNECTAKFNGLRLECESFLRKAAQKIQSRTTTANWSKFLRLTSSKTDTAFHRQFESLKKRLAEQHATVERQRDKEISAQKQLKVEAHNLKGKVECCLEYNKRNSDAEKACVDRVTLLLLNVNEQKATIEETLAFFLEISRQKDKKEDLDSYVPYHLRHLQTSVDKDAEDNTIEPSIEILGPPTDETVLKLRIKDLDKARNKCNQIISASIASREVIDVLITKLKSSLRALDGLLRRLHKPLFKRDTSLPGSESAAGDEGGEEDDRGREGPSSRVHALDHSFHCKGCNEGLEYVENCALYLASSVFRVQLDNQTIKDISELLEAVTQKGNAIDELGGFDDW